ncbi:glycosyltransferase [Priestia flexa]|uniref:glycosyltransferase n=1 Tax=Priestia flexa TaxID=86664 RepID=UPI003D035B9A
MNDFNCLIINMEDPVYDMVHWSEANEKALFEHLVRKYLPLVHYIQNNGLKGASIILSSLILGILDHNGFNQRFNHFIQRQGQFVDTLKQWDGRLLDALKYYQDEQIIECIAIPITTRCPSLLKTSKGYHLQISLAIELFNKYLGQRPKGFYLPNGDYTYELDKLLKAHNVEYSCIEVQHDYGVNLYTSSSGIFLLKHDALLPVISKSDTGLRSLKDGKLLYQCVKDINNQQKLVKISPKHESSRYNQPITEENSWFYKTMQQTEVKLSKVNNKLHKLERKKELAHTWIILASSEWLIHSKDDYNRQLKLFNQLCHVEEQKVMKNEYLQWVPDVVKECGIAYKETKKDISLYLPGNMSILMLAWEYPPLVIGGLARHVFDLSRALAKSGHYVVVITAFVEGLPLYECMYGVHVYRVKSLQPHHADFLTWVNSLNVAMALEGIRLAAATPFQVIHAHDWLVGTAAQGIASHVKKPLITTIHATEHGRNNGIHNEMQQRIHQREEELVHESTAIIVCSTYMKKEIMELFNIEPERISIFPNGIDQHMVASVVNRSKEVAVKGKFKLRNAPIFFSIGRIVYEKGFQLLIQAAEYFKQVDIDIQFIIAGKGPLLHEFQQQIKNRNLDQYIKFIGYITDEERNCLLHLSTGVIFPSLYEPFGIVALEGMVAKKPTIVSETGGLKDIVNHRVTGLTFKPGVVEELIHCVFTVITDSQLIQEISEKGYVEATTMFSWEQIALDTSALFQDQIKQSKRRKEKR